MKTPLPILAKVLHLALAATLFASASAQTELTVMIDTNSPKGRTIPEDFPGLSFGMRALLPDRDRGHFFSPSNTPLVTLFQNVGIQHLRVGGTTVESPPQTAIPDTVDIDSLFSFARTAGVRRIIYSLRLLETNSTLNYAATNVAIAKYVWTHYRSQLDCFALGNEPDLQRVYHQDFGITNFDTYLYKWRIFAAAIKSAVPEAKFAGPDAGSGNREWTLKFARKEIPSGLLKMITEHFYVGGKGKGVEPAAGIEQMLSPSFVAANERLFSEVVVPVQAQAVPFRFTEANDHYSGGVPEASDTFAGALWALDFLHWWAAHGVVGVDFHNTQWVVNDVITRDANGELMVNPKGYGVRAFAEGSHGYPEPLSLGNPGRVNVTAYCVRNGDQRFLTIINKEHGPNGRTARMRIVGVHAGAAELMFLKSANGDVAAKTGITLGGATIGSHSSWHGQWTRVTNEEKSDLSIDVPAATAAILTLPVQH